MEYNPHTHSQAQPSIKDLFQYGFELPDQSLQSCRYIGVTQVANLLLSVLTQEDHPGQKEPDLHYPYNHIPQPSQYLLSLSIRVFFHRYHQEYIPHHRFSQSPWKYNR